LAWSTPNLTWPRRKAQASIHALRRQAREAAREEAAAASAGGRENDSIVFTGPRALNTRLDSLPWPARDLLRNELYRSPETQNPLCDPRQPRLPLGLRLLPGGNAHGFQRALPERGKHRG